MARDKAKDDKMFNCSQDHEREYVANLYDKNAENVKNFLITNCKNGAIKNSTHKAVYELIKSKLDYPVPS
ncbi:hypothetical protein V2K52_13990 [Pseudomonas alliivorans]|nr:hypothetical protein [Pseudomonas alliivorans]MEE4791214.1 hypothetical protein [Pseudomonas alliivorans]MEE4797365.1 hypothetical protein [Pseudomonas alliivorans]MEE4807806.1 hypothetical protein [Pseudomonas alliivorans]MEE4822668.1 hypothetical protein [Pseudomonas alliivorans]